MAVEIVLVTDDTEWQTSFSRVIKEYPVEESVKMALETIEVFKTIIIGK